MDLGQDNHAWLATVNADTARRIVGISDSQIKIYSKIARAKSTDPLDVPIALQVVAACESRKAAALARLQQLAA